MEILSKKTVPRAVKGIALTAAIAAGLAPAAKANQTLSTKSGNTITHPELDRHAQRDIAKMAVNIVKLAETNSRAISYTRYNDPDNLKTLSVEVVNKPSRNSIDQTGYILSVTGPVNDVNGMPIPAQADAVTLQSYQTYTYGGSPSSEQVDNNIISFATDQYDDGMVYSATYGQPDTRGMVNLTGSTEPYSTELFINSPRLRRAYSQGRYVISQATARNEIGQLNPVFPNQVHEVGAPVLPAPPLPGPVVN
jgi:hypothetical protein